MKWLRSFSQKHWNTELQKAVEEEAGKSLLEFGYTDTEPEYGGVQLVFKLEHCEIAFWRYKMDVGCAIRPCSEDPNARYASVQVAERMVPSGAIRAEVQRQMRQIVETYASVLRGNLEGWPREDV